MTVLMRPRDGRMLAGVCRGMANRFSTSVTAVRIVTLLGLVFFGLSFWVYLALWLLVPDER
ncbi:MULTISPECIES: PspC domain-containing protein [Microbacterium]|uniref:PspC domain-containing protein n=1 Tax=Microbacterium TaxID=33882 RepID=UPI00146DB715|nr:MULTISPECIES: PspC domain-containing protein [Microbacterium]